MNKAILTGHLGKDPEVRTLESGKKVANFSLATSESYKDKDGNKVTKTEWHNVVMYGGLAGVAEGYLKKGSHVCIEGGITYRSWEKDGKKHYITEIIASGMEMLGGKTTNAEKTPDEVTGDLPF